MISQYLPSKKFSIFLLVLVFIALCFLGFKYFGNPFAKISQYKSAQSSDLKLEEFATKDTDVDGVPDWEEALWGTDPKNKDTKDSGVGDKAYIESRKLALNQSGGTNATDVKLNETDIFARDFLTAILSLKQQGQLNSTTVSNLSETVLKNAAVKTVLPDLFSANSLIEYKDSSMANIAKYHSDISKILKKYKDSVGNELQTMAVVVDSEGQSGLDELKATSTNYDSLAQELLKIKIPKDAVSLHLDLVNSAKNTSIAISNMSQLYENPLLGLIGVGQENIYSPKMITSMENLATYFAKNGIIN